MLITNNKYNKVKFSINEEIDVEDYYYEYGIRYVIESFLKNIGGKQEWGPLINPSMYQKALDEFTQFGKIEKFPTRYIYQWIGVIIKNTCILSANTDLAGHSSGFDTDDIENTLFPWLQEQYDIAYIKFQNRYDVLIATEDENFINKVIFEPNKYRFNNLYETMVHHKSGPNKGQGVLFGTQDEVDNYDEDLENFKQRKLFNENNQNLVGKINDALNRQYSDNAAKIANGHIEITLNIFDLLDYMGLFEWMVMPDGSDAFSDYGLSPLWEIINKYHDGLSPEDTLVLINKALDITHCRGDMSSIFIQGGRKTLFQISNGKYINEETYNVYHGSPCSTIVTGKFKKGKRGYLGPGIYFTDDKDNANRYSKKNGNGTIYTVEIDLYNPMIITSNEPTKEFLDKVYNNEHIYLNRKRKQENDVWIIETKDIKKFLSCGYDGVIWKFGSVTEYVLYDNSQIKIINKENSYKREDNNMLKEDKETNYQIKKIIKNLYRISQEHNKLYSDEAWENVRELVRDLKECNGITDVHMWAGQYHNYLNGSNDSPYRTYKIVLETEFGINIGGEITCSSAGTVQDPFSKYDMCCSFWKEQNLNEMNVVKRGTGKNRRAYEKCKHDIEQHKKEDWIKSINLDNAPDRNRNIEDNKGKGAMFMLSLNENRLRSIIRNKLMEMNMNGYVDPIDKETEMELDWNDIDSYGTTDPTDGAYDLGDNAWGMRDRDVDDILDNSNEVNRNIYDEEGFNSMRAMDRLYRDKEFREKYPLSVKDSGRYARNEKTFDNDNTFDDEIDKLGLNMEKDSTQKINEAQLRKIIRNTLKEMTDIENFEFQTNYAKQEKEKCEKLINTLNSNGIDASIRNNNGSYYVIVGTVMNNENGYKAEEIARKMFGDRIIGQHYPASTLIYL